jgi:hypothetical protein
MAARVHAGAEVASWSGVSEAMGDGFKAVVSAIERNTKVTELLPPLLSKIATNTANAGLTFG